MVVVGVKPGSTMYIDGFLKENLDFVIKKVHGGNDWLLAIIDGRVGTGKSTLAAQLGFYCSDGNFVQEDIVFTSKQFEERLTNSRPGQSIVLDEAFDTINRRKSRSEDNMLVLSLLQRARAKKVFVFLCLPCIYDLDKNVILNLCDLFINCYRKPFGTRGQFMLFDLEGIRKLYLFARQTLNYPRRYAKANIIGKFTKFFPVDYDEYEHRKFEAMKELSKYGTVGSKYREQRDRLINQMRQYTSVENIAEITELTGRQVYKILKRFEGATNET